MKKACIALLIIALGTFTSCVPKPRQLTAEAVLQPTSGMPKNIGIAD